MILARLTRAIRDQNWLAVVIEFTIVVAGVVIGFQISHSAERQSERAHARDAMVRVEAEAREIMIVRQRMRQNFNAHSEALTAARPVIMGHGEAVLTPEQCWAVAASNYITVPPDSLPTLAELMTSGLLAAVENDDLRLATMRFASKRETTREWARQHTYQIVDLPRLFPDMVWFELIETADDDGWDRQAVCDVDAMRSSRAFHAHLNRNYVVTRGTDSFVYDFMDTAFMELHDAIDTELALSHAGQEGANP